MTASLNLEVLLANIGYGNAFEHAERFVHVGARAGDVGRRVHHGKREPGHGVGVLQHDDAAAQQRRFADVGRSDDDQAFAFVGVARTVDEVV